MTVTTENTIELNGNKYKIKGQLAGAWIDPFPEQMVLGDVSYANRRDVSSWVINDLRGGIGIEEMDEAVDSKVCWWTNCITKYRNHMLPMRLATMIGILPTDRVLPVNADMELTTGWTNGARSAAQNHGGTYSWLVDPSTDAYQDLTWDNDYQSKTFTYKAWAWNGNTALGAAKIGIDDGITTTWSSNVASSSTWEQLTVTKTLAATATRLRLILFASSVTNQNYYDDVTEPGAATKATPYHFANFNGNLYVAMGNILGKLDSARTEIVYISQFTANITALIPSLNSRLYIYLGDSVNYWYMSTTEALTQSNSANAYWGIQYDAKLFKVNTSGTVAYSTDPDGATPTWTSGGAITDIADQIEGLVVGRDASGTQTLYCATNSILKAYDSTTPQWVDAEARLPNHPNGGKGATYWNGKLYLSYGLGVKEYYPETGAFLDIGLTERDGLPVEYNGEIVKLLGDTGTKGMFALVDASQSSGNSISGFYLYDGFGWQCWWTPTTGILYRVIEDCEDYWNETIPQDVVSSLDTSDFQVGAGSAKFVCAAGLGAGDIIATEAISPSVSLNFCSHVRFRIKSSVALNAGDLQLLLDNTNYCFSPLETLDIPAVAANTWTKVDIALANPLSDLYLVSVGLKMVVDKGAFTLNVDQIEAVYYNGVMSDTIISSASSSYAVYFDHRGLVYYIDIPRGIENPDKITSSYASGGILLTPWFDAGNPTALKLAKVLADFAKGITTTETVALKYRLDHANTDLDTGWTTLDTLNTAGEDGYNEELFASGAGLSFKAIQFRLDFVTPGSTAKSDIQSLVLYFSKRTGSVKVRTWTVTVICDNYGLTTAKQKVENLKSAITSATDVLFSYHPNDNSTESYYVKVDCPNFSEETGRAYESNYQITLTEA